MVFNLEFNAQVGTRASFSVHYYTDFFFLGFRVSLISPTTTPLPLHLVPLFAPIQVRRNSVAHGPPLLRSECYSVLHCYLLRISLSLTP
jgi:hypothetical protein